MAGEVLVPGDRARAAETLVEDEAFARLWTLCSERFVSWEEFSTLDMPAGCDAMVIWRVVTTLRRLAGRIVPLPRSPKPWCNLPLDEQRMVWDLLARSDASSQLYEYVRSRPYRGIDIQDQVDELVVCLAWDGRPMGYEAVRDIVVGNRKPLSDAEKVVDGYCRILEGEFSGAVAGRLPATLPSARDLYASLVKPLGVEPDVTDPFTVQRLSQSLARAGRGDAFETVVFSAHLFENPSWTRPFSTWNVVFGSLLRKVYFIRCSRAVLSFLPLTKAMFEQGSRSLEVALEVSSSLHHGSLAGSAGLPVRRGWIHSRDARPELWDENGMYYDLTPYFAVYLQKVSSCLDGFERRVKDDESHEEALRGLVRSSHRLNHRQRDVVLACLADTDVEFDYETYRDIYQVAYATARADLTDLANLSLLRSEVRGKRTVVYSVPGDLRRVVEARLG